jgi:hypothetical protein
MVAGVRRASREIHEKNDLDHSAEERDHAADHRDREQQPVPNDEESCAGKSDFPTGEGGA